MFSLFEGLEVEDLDKPMVNGHQSNGFHSPIVSESPKKVYN